MIPIRPLLSGWAFRYWYLWTKHSQNAGLGGGGDTPKWGRMVPCLCRGQPGSDVNWLHASQSGRRSHMAWPPQEQPHQTIPEGSTAIWTATHLNLSTVRNCSMSLLNTTWIATGLAVWWSRTFKAKREIHSAYRWCLVICTASKMAPGCGVSAWLKSLILIK